jgi:Phage Tail Collar Domain
MADTQEALLQTTVQETGNNDNTWGDIANENWELHAQAIAGQTAKSVTGGAVTLTDDEARSAVIIFSGTLTSTSTVTVPTRSKVWLVLDNTTGSYGVTMKTASGAGYRLPKGRPRQVFCDGANVKSVDAAGSVPIGAILHVGATALGWEVSDFLVANGALVATADYPELFARIGYNYGGAGASFGLPNTEGRYLRGSDGTYAVGAYLASELASHTHTASGSSSSTGSHSHGGVTSTTAGLLDYYPSGVNESDKREGSGGLFDYISSVSVGTRNLDHAHTISADGTHSHTITVTVNATGGTETRPATVVALGIVRYQ